MGGALCSHEGKPAEVHESAVTRGTPLVSEEGPVIDIKDLGSEGDDGSEEEDGEDEEGKSESEEEGSEEEDSEQEVHKPAVSRSGPDIGGPVVAMGGEDSEEDEGSEDEEEATVKLPPCRKSTFTEGADTVPEVTNDLDFGVSFAWVDYTGETTAAETCRAGSTWSKSTNADNVWVISRADTKEELACLCFATSGSVDLSDALASIADSVGIETKNGYFNGGGDFATAGSEDEAMKMCLANPGKVMGYTFSDPSACHVKVHGIGFSPAAGWKAVTVGHALDTAALQSLRRKKHNAVRGCPQVNLADCSWKCDEDDTMNCEKMGKEYEHYKVDGLSFFIEKGCTKTYPTLHDRISGDVMEIKRLLPERCFKILQEKSAIWINDVMQYPDEDEPRSGAWCHWGDAFLKGKGDLQEKAGCVEVLQAKQYLDWVDSQPSMLLHELSHSYHYWMQAKVDAIIKRAYEKGMASGKYKTGEHSGQMCEKPYCANNHMEYFAESSESFWSSKKFFNDYFPYVHCELKKFDPVAYKMCEDVWGVRGEDVATRGELPVPWLEKFARVDREELEEIFSDLDKDGTGLVDASVVAATVAARTEGLDVGAAKAMVAFCDVNADSKIDFEEFLDCMTMDEGAHL